MLFIIGSGMLRTTGEYFVFCTCKLLFMSKAVKDKISKLLDKIEDEAVLNQLMEDVAFYASKKDIVDQLSPDQLKELDKAIEEADNKETITWTDFKKEMKEWKKK